MENFSVFVVLFGALPLICYWVSKSNFQQDIKAIVPFLYVVFFSSIYEFFGTNILKINIRIWFVTYSVISFLSILYFFYNSIKKKKYNYLFIIYFILFLALCISNFNKWNDDFFLNTCSYFDTLQTVFIVLFSIIWYYENIKNIELNKAIAYFVSGILIYYTGTVFLFLIAENLFKSNKADFFDYWMLNVCLNLVLRTMLIIGVFIARKK